MVVVVGTLYLPSSSININILLFSILLLRQRVRDRLSLLFKGRQKGIQAFFVSVREKES